MPVVDPTRFPLYWPDGRPRHRGQRMQSRFKVDSFTRVRDELLNQLKLLGARDVILSSNLKLRQDQLPLAGQAQPTDTGVAVYFQRKGKSLAFACDQWRKIEENMQAIRHTIEALRGIARWGTGDMVDAAFAGFAALPAAIDWRMILGVGADATGADVDDAARRLLRDSHPDRGGTAEKFDEVMKAIEAARDAGIVA